MERQEAKMVIEAILFLHEEPVKAEKIGELIALSCEEVEELLREMKRDFFEGGRGLQVYETAGGYHLGTLPEFAPYLEKIFGENISHHLTSASLETLAIIAYKQPVTRLEIESIRGVKCDHLLEKLLKRKLIRISGRREGLGRPLIYSTTVDFLKYFGLKDLKELPPLG